MRTLRNLLAAAAFAPLLAFAQQQPSEEGKRVALVIGNDNYSIRPLQNAVNDARAMQKALSSAGFFVIERENAGKVGMEEAIAAFLEKIGPGDVALFYYAGHAIQIENENVLVPTDFTEARSLIDAKFKSFSMTPVMTYLKTSRAKTVILIIDACRSNPVAQTHSLKAGLATPLDAGKNTYIAYSTSPNNVAGDNPNGRNSWFTEALASTIAVPGLTIDDVLTRVRDKVADATAGKQIPWSYTSLTSKFYFFPPRNGESENNESLIAKWLQDALRNEQYGNWQEAIDLAERIVKQKPGGSVEETAKARLPYLKARETAQNSFEKGDYATAIAQYDQALKLEPFDVEAAFEGSSGALLADDLPRAVQLLQVIRQRGTTPQVQRADAILKELSAAEPSASAALKGGAVKPPAIQEVFHTHRFGAPDWDTGWRLVRQAPAQVDYAAIAKKLPPPPAVQPPPSPVANPTGSAAAATAPQQQQPQHIEQPQQTAAVEQQQVITLDDLYVDVKAVGGTRDLVTEEFGQITIRSFGKKEIGLMLEGRPVTRKLPYTAKLPPGKYEIRTMEAGKSRSERRVEVKSGNNPDLVLQ
jgi:tetratricopeptide (TPR) repeat protein